MKRPAGILGLFLLLLPASVYGMMPLDKGAADDFITRLLTLFLTLFFFVLIVLQAILFGTRRFQTMAMVLISLFALSISADLYLHLVNKIFNYSWAHFKPKNLLSLLVYVPFIFIVFMIFRKYRKNNHV